MKNILKEKTYVFALKIVRLYKSLKEQKEYDLSRQLLRSGTATGALVREAEFAQSKKDFISKLSIGLKEANETDYWLDLLHDSEMISKESYNELKLEIKEIISIKVASIKTAKNNSK